MRSARDMQRFLPLFALVLVVLWAPAYADARGEISALEMREKCRGIEAAPVSGHEIAVNTTRYPEALTCWGAFQAIRQASRYFYEGSGGTLPMFLPDVCSSQGGRIQPAEVLIRVFTH